MQKKKKKTQKLHDTKRLSGGHLLSFCVRTNAANRATGGRPLALLRMHVIVVMINSHLGSVKMTDLS